MGSAVGRPSPLTKRPTLPAVAPIALATVEGTAEGKGSALAVAAGMALASALALADAEASADAAADATPAADDALGGAVAEPRAVAATAVAADAVRAVVAAVAGAVAVAAGGGAGASSFLQPIARATGARASERTNVAEREGIIRAWYARSRAGREPRRAPPFVRPSAVAEVVLERRLRMPNDADDSKGGRPPAPRPDAPPTSRLGRLARLGALGTKALPVALGGARRALLGAKTEEDAEAARKRMLADSKKAAEAMLATLGEMKGLPLKLGQMASYIDGIAPPGYEEKFQRTLRKLQEKAPPLSAEAAERVVLEDLGAPPEQIFASYEREPFAAASIGQVHRAVTKAGERVAVKVQYPGIDKAIENDLKSLAILESFASPLARKYRTKETLDEIRAVFLSEVDYTNEAENLETFRRICADLPGVHLPRVVHSLTSRRVITLEYVEGKTYAEFCAEATQQERNRAGEIIWSLMFRSLLRHGALYADPHPGNYRFLPNGDVAFLDFGCVKYMPAELVAGLKRCWIAAMDQDWPEFDRALVEELGYDPTDPEGWDLYRSYTLELLLPLTMNGAFQCSPTQARETVAYLVRGHKRILFKEGAKVPTMPTLPRPPIDMTFLNRLQWGLASVLGGLHTEAKFREITEPWVRAPFEPLRR